MLLPPAFSDSASASASSFCLFVLFVVLCSVHLSVVAGGVVICFGSIVLFRFVSSLAASRLVCDVVLVGALVVSIVMLSITVDVPLIDCVSQITPI